MKNIAALTLLAALMAPAQAAPTLEASWPEGPVVVNAPFVVTLEAAWAGKIDDFVPLPVEMPALEDAAAEVTAAQAEATEDGARISYAVEITPHSVGELEIPAIAVPLAAGGAEAGTQEQLPLAASTLQSEAHTVTVVEDAGGALRWWMIPGFVIVAALVVLYVRRQKRPPETAADPWEKYQAHLSSARRRQLDGEYYEFYQDLAAAAACAPGTEAKTLSGKLQKRAEQVGYQGVQPPEAELASDLREVEREAGRALRPEKELEQ